MKKSVFILSAAATLAMSFVACKSTKQIVLTDYSPITVASVYSNSSVPWYSKDGERDPTANTSSGGLVTSHLNKALEQNNPEYQTVQARIDEAADILIHCLEENGVEVVSNDLLQETATYKSGFNRFMKNINTSTAAEGYLPLDYNGKGRNRVIATETGSAGTLFAEFIFQKEKIATGLISKNVAAKVTLKVYVADAHGNKVLYKTYKGLSTESIDYDNGDWDRAKVVSFFPSVIESVVNQFILDFTGSPLDETVVADEGESKGTSVSLKKLTQTSEDATENEVGEEPLDDESSTESE